MTAWSSAAHWRRFFWEDRERDFDTRVIDDEYLELHVAPGLGLDLRVDCDADLLTLYLAHPSVDEAIPIAEDNDAHWVPHVLRWSELELLCRAIAIASPELPHPGLPLLLLHRFAPICDGDDTGQIVGTLERAWSAIPDLHEDEVTRWIERADHRHDGFRWREDRGRWVIEQLPPEAGADLAGLYSYRESVDGDFPFSLFEDVMEHARRLVAEVGVSMRVEERPKRTLRAHASLRLDLPYAVVDPAAPSPRVVVEAVDLAVREARCGSASSHGGMSRPDGRGGFVNLWDHAHVDVRGDLDIALAAVTSALRSVGASTQTKLEVRAPVPRVVDWRLRTT